MPAPELPSASTASKPGLSEARRGRSLGASKDAPFRDLRPGYVVGIAILAGGIPPAVSLARGLHPLFAGLTPLVLFAAIFLAAAPEAASDAQPTDAGDPTKSALSVRLRPSRRVLWAAVPAALVALWPSWKLAQALLAGAGLDQGLLVIAPVAALFSLVYAASFVGLIAAAARWTASPSHDAASSVFLATAPWLCVAGAHARFAAEADHLHALAPVISLPLFVAGIAIAVAAALVDLGRARWLGRVFAGQDRGWAVAPMAAHERDDAGPMLPLVSSPSPADGLLFRCPTRAPEGAYRDWIDRPRAVATIPLDRGAALRPFHRRIVGALVYTIGALVFAPALLGPLPARAHDARVHPPDPTAPPRHPLALPAGCVKPGKVYLAPVGQLGLVDVSAIAARYRTVYGLDAEALPPIEIDADVIDARRRQAIAERVIDAMHEAHPEIAREPGAVFLGVTDVDMFMRSVQEWRFVFASRRDRTAVISTARMNLGRAGRREASRAALEARLYKMVTRNLGFLRCGRAPSDAPESVMSASVLGLDDLDRLDESVW